MLRAKPMFIDSSADGNFVLILDGTQVLSANFTPQWNSNGTPVLGPGPSGGPTTTPDGGSISYTSNVTATEIDVSISLTTLIGKSHVLGVVQENGACQPDPYGRATYCLGNPNNPGSSPAVGDNNGYVLAEGQTAPFTLTAGSSNTPISLTLQGVLEAGYLCDAACDGGVGTPDANGVYHITAFPVDENGSAVTSSTYSNGWWDIEEMDSQGIVTISTTNPQPFNSPNIDASGWDAQPFTFTCNKIGSTYIAIRLLPSDPGSGPVTGFSYSSANYPAAGSVLSSVGEDLWFGNELAIVPVTCEGSVTITVN